MLVLQDCLEKLASFKEVAARKYGVTRLGIFGSVARGDNTEDSDLDVVVEMPNDMVTLKNMYDMEEELKSLFGCDVDLVQMRDSLRPLLKSFIKRDTVYA